MTGGVPYYGGRFTPAQAYAAAHPSPPARPAPVPPPPVPPPAEQPPTGPRQDPVEALQHLLDSGVLTPEEHDELRRRVAR